MATYDTKTMAGGIVTPFHPLTILIEPVAGTTVLPSGTLELMPAGEVRDGKITFSDGGKRFAGYIRTGVNGPVEYWGWLRGESEREG